MAQSIVYVHGVPESGDMWRPFVERTGGDAPDLPGFGKTAKPATGDYTFRGLARWFSDYTRELDRYSLVVHDWGSLGLLAAIERPDAIERLVIVDAVPFLPGYRWHPIARVWRRPLLGELSMGLSTKRGVRLLDRNATSEAIESWWKYFDHGTQRAILRLYRSADEPLLEEAGRDLAKITAPTLVVWGAEDPYIPTRFAHDYANAVGGPADVEIVEGAGHWPWYEKPQVIERIATFLQS